MFSSSLTDSLLLLCRDLRRFPLTTYYNSIQEHTITSPLKVSARTLEPTTSPFIWVTSFL